MFNAIYKFPAYQFDCTDGLHQQDLDRRLPRRRPARGDVRHRADDGRAGGRGRRRPAGDPREELDQARGVPVHHGGRARVRLRQLRGRHGQGEGAVRLRRAARASSRRAASRKRPGPARHRHLDLHRDVRPRAVPRPRRALVRRRRLGARRRSGCSPTGKVEVVTGRPAPTARATRRRGARSSPTGSGSPFEDIEVLHGDTQVSPKGLDTYGSRSLVVGGQALVMAADKVIEKAKPIAAHLLEASRRRHRVHRRHVQRQGHRQGHGHGRGGRVAAFAAHNLPDGIEPTLDAEATFDPVELLLPARHPPVRHGGRHRDRRVDDAQVRLRRRHRQHHQPAHRRGPGARRPRPGHRPGAVGGGRLRRARAPSCPARSSTTRCRRRPTRSASSPTTRRRRRRPTPRHQGSR